MEPHLDTIAEGATNWATVCLNCDAVLSGPFCGTCGQRALPPHPTTRELAGEAYQELVGWDGKVADTIRLLLRYPGELTGRLLDGQRSRYISPVRLYLTCSVLYFIVVAWVPLPDTASLDVGVGIGSAEAQTPGEAAFAKALTQGLASLTPSEQAAVEQEIAAQPRFIQPAIRAVATDYPSLQKRVSEIMPRALFILVPVLALVLGLFYRGRHFPEHLYFAVHFQAFVFLVLTVVALLQYSRVLFVLAASQILAALVIVTYGVLSQRRVYGGTWTATALKAVGIAILYLTAWSTTTIIVTLWVSR